MDSTKCVVARAARHPAGQRVRVAASIAAVALLALLHGCAKVPGEESTDFVCHSAQQCRVTVEVNCGASGCRASVDHPRVLARGNDVVWIVDNKPGQSYAFRIEDGVFFKTDAGRQAFRCHREAAANRYACMNNRAPGTYEYGIQLIGSPAVPTLDPWVVN